MSVVKAGVRGYEYQYQVTVLVTLLHLGNSKAIFVEKIGSEDATIQLNTDDKVSIVEIQMKDTLKPVNLKLICQWLCHFQENTTDNNLLSRLIDSSNVALIVSSGRCTDDASLLVQDSCSLQIHDNLQLSKLWKKNFADHLDKNEFTGGSSQQRDRNNFCKDLGEKFKDDQQLFASLNKVLIWEQMSKNKVEYLIETTLNQKYGVPQSVCRSTRLELIEIIKKGRDLQIDILPMANSCIDKSSRSGPIIDHGYQRRKIEATLSDQLENEGILLLSGRTQCGKTELAKKIALQFYRDGHTYKITHDINAVESFFSTDTLSDKVCILEDPWGHLEASPNAADILKKLEMLIRYGTKNHKLIVTSREEIIEEIARSGLKKINSIHQQKWQNITLLDKDELLRFWTLFSDDNEIISQVKETIFEHIDTCFPSDLLQIGELQQLARYDFEDCDSKALSHLLHIARQTSEELASELNVKHPRAAELLAAICCLGNTIISIDPSDLTYLLSEDIRFYSVHIEKNWVSNRKVSPFPSYPQRLEIEDDWKTELEYLERRGIVNFANGKYQITHPNYYEAGRMLFTSVVSAQQSRIIEYFKKAIGCISPLSSLHAVKQLGFLYPRIEGSYKGQVSDIGFFAFESIFPAVKDQALIFLTNHSSDFSADQKRNVQSILDNEDTPSYDLSWYNGIPYLPVYSLEIYGEPEVLPEKEVNDVRSRLKSQSPLSTLEAWRYLLAVSDHKASDLDVEEQKILLKFEEVFVRKKVSELALTRNIPNLSEQTIQLIYSDSHPSVQFKAIAVTLKNWKYYSPEIKGPLKEAITLALQNWPVAIRCNQFLTTFAKEGSSESISWNSYSEEEKKELWNLWSELFILIVGTLPAKLFLDATSFGSTIDIAVTYITKTNAMAVLTGWYNRIDFKIQHDIFLDEYEMAVADVLFTLTKYDWKTRAELFGKMIAHENTCFIISSLKWTIDYWDYLYQEEKENLILLAQAKRPDQRWIKAIMLSRDEVPEPIQLAILGDEHCFNKSPAAFTAQIDRTLLSDCLKVYFGKPQPFWWLATQYKNIEFWKEVTYYILENEVHPFFEICLKELSSWGINGFSFPWNDGIKVWEKVCVNTVDKDAIVKRYIYDVSHINFNFATTKLMFDKLHEVYHREGREHHLVTLVADDIELMQQTIGGPQDLLKIFSKDFLGKLFNKFSTDKLITDQILMLSTISMDQDTFLQTLNTFNEGGKALRFHPTKTLLKNIAKELSLSPAFEDAINRMNFSSIDAIGRQKAEKWKQTDEYKLSDWVGKH